MTTPSNAFSRRARSATILLAFLSFVAASELSAQVRRGRAQQTAPRWAPVSAGVRFGYDQSARGEIIGVHLHVPVIRSGVIEVSPSAERIFVLGTNETQYTVQLDYVPGGLRGGVILGAGLAWRDAIAGTNAVDPRRTYFGYTAMVGGKNNFGPVQIEIGLRWTFLDDTGYQPQAATLGLNVPFWRVGPGGS